MDAARRAGATHASAATKSSSAVTPARIIGSRELSVIHCAANVSNARHRQDAGDESDTDVPGRARQNHAHDVARLGAERHADPEFVRSVATPYETTL